MIKKFSYLFLIVFFASDLKANVFSKYKIGSGARYDLKFKSSSSQLLMYVASKSDSEMSIEMKMSSYSSFMPIEMWQQFSVEFDSSKTQLNLKKAYIYTAKMSHPQKLSQEYMNGYGGLKMTDFLISSESDLSSYKKKVEKVNTPAGEVEATHYQMQKSGQTLDFWISKEAKPFGLVKLKSKGTKPTQNYILILGGLVINATKKIDPETATELDAYGKSILPKPGGQPLGLP